MGLVIGVLIYLVYVNLLGAAKVWFEQGDTPIELGFGGFMDALLFF